MKRKKITLRQKKIILMIVESSGDTPITIAEIAKNLELSSRTVLRDMVGIEKWFNENDFKFIKKPGVGLILDETLENRQLIVELLEEEKIDKEYTKEERSLIILSKLLVSNEPIKSYYFIKILKVSEGTLNNDFILASEWLKKFKLELVRKPGLGVYLDGKEKNFRDAYINLIHESYNEKEILDLVRGISYNIQSDRCVDELSENRLLNLIDKSIIKKVQITLNKKLADLDINLADSAYIGLVVHISLAIHRIKNGENITMQKRFLEDLSLTDEFKLAENIVNAIAKEFKMEIPLDEVGYITMHIKGAKQRISEQRDEFNLDDVNVINITNKMIEMAELEFKVPLKQDDRLLRDLANHLGPSISRLNMGMKIRNPLLERIKTEYRYVYNIVDKISIIVKEKLKIEKIPESEIAYLTMHFASAIERSLMTNTDINVVVSCPTGIGTSRFLVTKLQNKFSNLNILGTISAINIDEEHLKRENIDLIISTVELNTNVDYICVSPFMNSEDEIAIRKKIKEIAKVKMMKLHLVDEVLSEQEKQEQFTEIMHLGKDILLFLEEIEFHKKECRSLNELIDTSAKIFAKNENSSKKISKSLKDRVDIAIPYIEDSNILLLHCISEEINNMKLAVINLTKSVLASEDKKIDDVVLMILPRNSKNYQREILSEISGLLIEEDDFVKQIKESLENEIKDKLKNVVYDFYANKLRELAIKKK